MQRAAGPCVMMKPAGVVVELHDLREAKDPIRALSAVHGEKPAKLKKALPALAAFQPGDDITADLDALRAALEGEA